MQGFGLMIEELGAGAVRIALRGLLPLRGSGPGDWVFPGGSVGRPPSRARNVQNWFTRAEAFGSGNGPYWSIRATWAVMAKHWLPSST